MHCTSQKNCECARRKCCICAVHPSQVRQCALQKCCICTLHPTQGCHVHYRNAVHVYGVGLTTSRRGCKCALCPLCVCKFALRPHKGAGNVQCPFPPTEVVQMCTTGMRYMSCALHPRQGLQCAPQTCCKCAWCWTNHRTTRPQMCSAPHRRHIVFANLHRIPQDGCECTPQKCFKCAFRLNRGIAKMHCTSQKNCECAPRK